MKNFLALWKDKYFLRALIVPVFLFGFMFVYEFMTAPPNPETVIPQSQTAVMESAEPGSAVVDLADRMDTARGLVDLNIRPWSVSTGETWLYRITYNPGTEDELVVTFGDVWLKLGEYTYVVENGTEYAEILEWAKNLYLGE
ncbi:MAG: hypothetical protein IKC09_08430 [Oscillospiraceae bacterium]|nr:hypothetical protein [Oscillospiraceae bacterium]